MNIFEKLDRPEWLDSHICLLSLGGSRVYGCSNEQSDYDYMGVCTMPEPYLKPEKYGYIYGFDQLPDFKNYTVTGVLINGAISDITVYGLTEYFKLLMGGNPNVIEPLFTKNSELITINSIGKLIRSRRNLFIAKNLIKNTLSYAASQLRRVYREPIGKRMLLVEEYGYDTKSMSHVHRLLSNCLLLLETGTMQLDYSAEAMKVIRSGKVKLEDITSEFSILMLELENMLKDSQLPDKPPVEDVRDLLKECLK